MLVHLLISVISDDKPGVVEALAETVSQQEGNWLESRLSQLAGKFAGVIRVSVDSEYQKALEDALNGLTNKGIWVKTELVDAQQNTSSASNTAYIHALGPDRPGIIRELSKALSSQNINMANLETALSSMPYSGEPLFEATGELEMPENIDIPQLHDILDDIADNLALDLSLSQTPFED